MYEYIDAATTGKFHVEFTKIVLSRNDALPDETPMEGKGYLAQNDKSFRLTFFPEGQEPIDLFYFLRHLATGGNLIPRGAFFTAHCVGLDGIRWVIEDILPGSDSGPGGSVVHANVRELRWNETLPGNSGGSPYGATLYFLGQHDFVANEIVKTEKTIGNNAPSTSLSFAAATIKDVQGVQIRIQKHETYTTLSAWSDHPVPPTFRFAAWHALEFSMGRVLECVLTVERHNTTLSGIVRPWLDPNAQPYCEPPVMPYDLNTQQDYWPLFSKVLSRLMQADSISEALSSCSSEVISVGNSLLGVQTLVRCVAVESLCNVISESSAINDNSLKNDQERLVQHLDNSGYQERFIKRVKGFLGAMRGISAKDTLNSLLKDQKILEESHIRNWSDLRHGRTHGRVVTGETAENDFNRMRAVLGLFYRLVFYMVGYTGPSKDYLKPEQPVFRQVTKAEMDKELAAMTQNNAESKVTRNGS